MIRLRKTILKFGRKGEKTGWSYIEIDAPEAVKLNSGSKVSFRVKGRIHKYTFEGLALLPMGNGNFILPLKADIRTAIGKKHGDELVIEMQLDSKRRVLSHDLMKCLKEEPDALIFFKSLPRSHQHYFSKWIEDSKTMTTKTRRIVQAVIALANKQGFGEMLRANKREY